LGELQANFDPKISECSERRNYAGDWNILVPAGKDNNNYSLISRERKGKRANRICFWKGVRDVVKISG